MVENEVTCLHICLSSSLHTLETNKKTIGLFKAEEKKNLNTGPRI